MTENAAVGVLHPQAGEFVVPTRGTGNTMGCPKTPRKGSRGNREREECRKTPTIIHKMVPKYVILWFGFLLLSCLIL